jgi:flagellar basal body-associated protein FliL
MSKGGENMKNKNTMIIVAVVLVIVAAAGGFFGGMIYQKNQAPALGAAGRGSLTARFGQGGQGGQAAAAFRPVRGQVLSTSSNSLTVKMSDGSTKIVVLSTSTAFMQSTKAASSDVKTGDTVNVVGTANSDGSVTAQDIQINPPAQGGFGRPGGQGQQPPVQPTTGAGQ